MLSLMVQKNIPPSLNCSKRQPLFVRSHFLPVSSNNDFKYGVIHLLDQSSGNTFPEIEFNQPPGQERAGSPIRYFRMREESVSCIENLIGPEPADPRGFVAYGD